MYEKGHMKNNNENCNINVETLLISMIYFMQENISKISKEFLMKFNLEINSESISLLNAFMLKIIISKNIQKLKVFYQENKFFDEKFNEVINTHSEYFLKTDNQEVYTESISLLAQLKELTQTKTEKTDNVEICVENKEINEFITYLEYVKECLNWGLNINITYIDFIKRSYIELFSEYISSRINFKKLSSIDTLLKIFHSKDDEYYSYSFANLNLTEIEYCEIVVFQLFKNSNYTILFQFINFLADYCKEKTTCKVDSKLKTESYPKSKLSSDSLRNKNNNRLDILNILFTIKKQTLEKSNDETQASINLVNKRVYIKEIFRKIMNDNENCYLKAKILDALNSEILLELMKDYDKTNSKLSVSEENDKKKNERKISKGSKNDKEDSSIERESYSDNIIKIYNSNSIVGSILNFMKSKKDESKNEKNNEKKDEDFHSKIQAISENIKNSTQNEKEYNMFVISLEMNNLINTINSKPDLTTFGKVEPFKIITNNDYRYRFYSTLFKYKMLSFENVIKFELNSQEIIDVISIHNIEENENESINENIKNSFINNSDLSKFVILFGNLLNSSINQKQYIIEKLRFIKSKNFEDLLNSLFELKLARKDYKLSYGEIMILKVIYINSKCEGSFYEFLMKTKSKSNFKSKNDSEESGTQLKIIRKNDINYEDMEKLINGLAYGSNFDFNFLVLFLINSQEIEVNKSNESNDSENFFINSVIKKYIELQKTSNEYSFIKNIFSKILTFLQKNYEKDNDGNSNNLKCYREYFKNLLNCKKDELLIALSQSFRFINTEKTFKNMMSLLLSKIIRSNKKVNEIIQDSNDLANQDFIINNLILDLINQIFIFKICKSFLYSSRNILINIDEFIIQLLKSIFTIEKDKKLMMYTIFVSIRETFDINYLVYEKNRIYILEPNIEEMKSSYSINQMYLEYLILNYVV